VLLIPERTTCLVFFFRQYKIYVRLIEDHVRVCLHDAGIKLHERSFTMQMHSVVYYQLGASAYTNKFLYVWKKCGYTIHRTCDTFVNTIAVSFNFGLETCLIDGCATFAFVRCSQSTRFYCFQHFIPNPHLYFDDGHDDDVQQHVIHMCNNMSYTCATCHTHVQHVIHMCNNMSYTRATTCHTHVQQHVIHMCNNDLRSCIGHFQQAFPTFLVFYLNWSHSDISHCSILRPLDGL
jgi:hypothetical protein